MLKLLVIKLFLNVEGGLPVTVAEANEEPKLDNLPPRAELLFTNPEAMSGGLPVIEDRVFGRRVTVTKSGGN